MMKAEYYFLIKRHRGKRGKYYTLHLVSDNEGFLRIYGRYKKLRDAEAKAKKLMRKMGNMEVIVR